MRSSFLDKTINGLDVLVSWRFEWDLISEFIYDKIFSQVLFGEIDLVCGKELLLLIVVIRLGGGWEAIGMELCIRVGEVWRWAFLDSLLLLWPLSIGVEEGLRLLDWDEWEIEPHPSHLLGFQLHWTCSEMTFPKRLILIVLGSNKFISNWT